MAVSFRRGRARIGLDVGATAVRAAEIRLNPPTLARVAQVRVQPGAVENGEVKDPAAVASALEELWMVGKFNGRQVQLGIGNQRVVVREITLPWLTEKELRESLPFQVQEHIPIPVDETVLDYQVIEELEQDGRRMVRLLLVAAHKAMVQRLVEAAELAKLIPMGIDIVPFALIRSIGTVEGTGLASEEGAAEAVLDVGADITSVVVHSQGLPHFVRMLASGGRDVTEAISRSVSVSEEEAERLKRGESTEAEDVKRQATDVAHARSSAFVDEIRSSLDFYAAQAGGGRIGRMVLTGGGSKLDGLLETLREQLPYDVMPGKAFQRVAPTMDLVPEAMAAAEPLLSVAVGLAIPGDAA